MTTPILSFNSEFMKTQVFGIFEIHGVTVRHDKKNYSTYTYVKNFENYTINK